MFSGLHNITTTGWTKSRRALLVERCSGVWGPPRAQLEDPHYFLETLLTPQWSCPFLPMLIGSLLLAGVLIG